MSTKKANLYNMAWSKLCEVFDRKGEAVSAGEFAVKMGIARSTAKRWLTEMVSENGCSTIMYYGRNGLLAVGYLPMEFDIWVQQQKYIDLAGG